MMANAYYKLIQDFVKKTEKQKVEQPKKPVTN
jgi:plasmid segregation protein ParM